jgi:hypothetical protein
MVMSGTTTVEEAPVVVISMDGVVVESIVMSGTTKSVVLVEIVKSVVVVLEVTISGTVVVTSETAMSVV